MKYLFILDNNNRLLQGTTMYDSLNVQKFKSYLISYLPNIEFITHNTLINDPNYYNIKDAIIIYSTSQVRYYKQYVELLMYHFDKNNTLIPSIDALYSHENKAFEYIWLRENWIHNLDIHIFGDKNSFTNAKIKYPVVLKTPSGSSSRGVKIVKSEQQAINFINTNKRKQLFSELMTTPFIQWPHHIKDTHNNCNFIVQEVVKDYEGDYRVQVMGDKFFVYFRKLRVNKQYTSGNGSINIYDCEVPLKLLDTARELQSKIKSPIIIFDMIYNPENCKVSILEFSAIHPSNVAIDNCNKYYYFDDSKWQTAASSKDRELIHAQSYVYAIENNNLN